MYRGRVAFGAMQGGAIGRPAADAEVEQIDRAHAARALLMVGGTLNRETSENEIMKSTQWVPRTPREIDDPAQIREILLPAA